MVTGYAAWICQAQVFDLDLGLLSLDSGEFFVHFQPDLGIAGMGPGDAAAILFADSLCRIAGNIIKKDHLMIAVFVWSEEDIRTFCIFVSEPAHQPGHDLISTHGLMLGQPDPHSGFIVFTRRSG